VLQFKKKGKTKQKRKEKSTTTVQWNVQTEKREDAYYTQMLN